MSKEKKEDTSIQPPIVEEEQETYLNYTIEKLIIIVKDNGVVNIDRMMSGEPKNDPPRP